MRCQEARVYTRVTTTESGQVKLLFLALWGLGWYCFYREDTCSYNYDRQGWRILTSDDPWEVFESLAALLWLVVGAFFIYLLVVGFGK